MGVRLLFCPETISSADREVLHPSEEEEETAPPEDPSRKPLKSFQTSWSPSADSLWSRRARTIWFYQSKAHAEAGTSTEPSTPSPFRPTLLSPQPTETTASLLRSSIRNKTPKTKTKQKNWTCLKLVNKISSFRSEKSRISVKYLRNKLSKWIKDYFSRSENEKLA